MRSQPFSNPDSAGLRPGAKPMAAPTGPAGMLDGVLVINLDQRPERLERFQLNAAPHSSLRHWERLPAVNGQQIFGFGQRPWFRGRSRDKGWAGRAGCTLSHRRAIETARQRGWRRVLILEDDAEFGPGFDQELADLMQILDARTQGWQVCYLGVSQAVGPSLPLASLAKERQLFAVLGCVGTFAYVLKAEAYDWVLARLPDEHSAWPWVARHRAIDRWYARNLIRRMQVTAVSPGLVGHYASFSDIGQRSGAAINTVGAATDYGPPITGSSSASFALGRQGFRLYFWLADQVNRLRAFDKQMRGF